MTRSRTLTQAREPLRHDAPFCAHAAVTHARTAKEDEQRALDLYDRSPEKRQATLRVVGTTHIDPAWLWRWQEGFQSFKATIRSALARIDKWDDFVFTNSSLISYWEMLEHNEPELFEQCRQRVAEGRIKITGGMMVEPDCNLPSGESFVRQTLYAQRWLKDKFGITAEVGSNYDPFGHNVSLPQILKKSGMDTYMFLRPKPHEKEMQSRLFWWEAPDGSRILTFRIPNEYGVWGTNMERHMKICAAEVEAPYGEIMALYGVGDHGGGPTDDNLEQLHAMQKDPNWPKIVFSSPSDFFTAMKEKGIQFPVVEEDLQYHAVGCYSAHSGVKRWNREAENALLEAEKLSALVEHVTGLPYPKEFRLAWSNVLFNQHHDTLGGTCLKEVYDDALDQYGEAKSIAARALNHAMQSVSYKIDIEREEGMEPIVAFNPHGWNTKPTVELELGKLPEKYVLVDDRGNEVPHQIVRSSSACRGRHRLSFTADLPPLGYRLYKLRPVAPEEPVRKGVKATSTTMENDRFRLELDAKSGTIKGLFDKKANRAVFSGEAAKAVVIDDPSDTWSHEIAKFENAIGKFKAKRVRLLEDGPVKSVIRVVSEYGKSTLTQDFTMYPDKDQIDVAVKVDWHEQLKMLKLRFPVNVTAPKATCEVPYAFIERDNDGHEECGQSWMDVSGQANGKEYGVSFLNDGKYSFDVKGNNFGLTVLRSPVFAHHDPAELDPDEDYEFIDQGVQRFNYSIIPHEGGWREANTPKRAAELNQRAQTTLETYHPGPLPQSAFFLSVDADNVIANSVKKAEEGDDLIVRLYETHGKDTKTKVAIPTLDRVLEVELSPCEIKTLKVPRDPNAPVRETNLIEWDAM